jgi:hypothetical protein
MTVTVRTWESAHKAVEARLAEVTPPKTPQVLCWPTGAVRGGVTITKIDHFTRDLFSLLAERSDARSVDIDPDVSSLHPAAS